MATSLSKTTLHRNGDVTYWSVYQQRWLTATQISDQELAAMATKERERVLRHLRRLEEVAGR